MSSSNTSSNIIMGRGGRIGPNASLGESSDNGSRFCNSVESMDPDFVTQVMYSRGALDHTVTAQFCFIESCEALAASWRGAKKTACDWFPTLKH